MGKLLKIFATIWNLEIVNHVKNENVKIGFSIFKVEQHTLIYICIEMGKSLTHTQN